MSSYQAISEQFFHNRLLFGDPADSAIVALEVASPTEVEVFKRRGDSVASERRPLALFALVADRALLKGLGAPHRPIELEGDAAFRYALRLGDLGALEAAKRHFRKLSGKSPGTSDAPYFVLNDPIEQHLLLCGCTFFLGMEFGALRRLQLDVQACVTAGFEFPNPAREDDRIAAIAISDSTGFERVLSAAELEEKAMLEALVAIVRERDPDVIEGHNLLRFDLEYLEARARRHKVQLGLGRNGGPIRSRSARMQIAERSIAYRRAEVYGRSLIDTWILAQHYDIASRQLEGFELGELAAHFRLQPNGRVNLERHEVRRCLAEEPQALMRCALDNARDVRSLAELLAPSYFVQAQIFPYSYQNVVLRGNATKIDSLMLRAYMTAGHAVPTASEPSEVLGGYTEVRRCGVARQVLHCDVTSLYPSLMLQYGHGPSRDRLGVFLRMLEDLRSFRVQAKKLAREASGSDRRNLEAMQQTFKILINSFYGYLGFGLGHFNDFGQANEVTRRGRELIQRAIAELEARGAQVLEVDTDGIYFVASFGWGDEQAEERLLEELGEAMPEGIRLEIDGRYPAMFSYKMKNYVLLDESGELTIRGSGLKSRGLERFQRRFMEELFALLLGDRRQEAEALLAAYRDKLERHQIGIRDLMKTETLQDSLEVYRQKVSGKRRNAAAAYELALKSARPFSSGDRISYYVTGRGAKVKVSSAARMASEYDPSKPDENIEYYRAKLDELYAKFRPYIEREGLFPPGALEDGAPEPVQEEIFSGPAGDGDQ